MSPVLYEMGLQLKWSGRGWVHSLGGQHVQISLNAILNPELFPGCCPLPPYSCSLCLNSEWHGETFVCLCHTKMFVLDRSLHPATTQPVSLSSQRSMSPLQRPSWMETQLERLQELVECHRWFSTYKFNRFCTHRLPLILDTLDGENLNVCMIEWIWSFKKEQLHVNKIHLACSEHQFSQLITKALPHLFSTCYLVNFDCLVRGRIYVRSELLAFCPQYLLQI